MVGSTWRMSEQLLVRRRRARRRVLDPGTARAGALAFGSGIGVLRIAGGGHFFTDVVFAGVLMYLVNLLAYWLIYGRRANRMTEKPADPPPDVQAEKPL